MHVFGAGLVTDQDDLFASLVGIDGIIGGEVDAAHSGARRCRKALGQHLALAGELGVQHLVEVFGGDAHERLVLGDLPTRRALARALGHLDCHAQRSSAGALTHAGLQHPELALIDGELGVAHVLVVPLEPVEDGEQFFVNDREVLGHRIEVFGVADTGNHVFALGVDEEVAVRLVVAGSCVTGEAHAGAAVVVAVAEHHHLHVHRGAQFVADLLAHAVSDGARTVPALEHGFDRAAQLRRGVLREGLLGDLLHHGLVLLAQPLQHLGRQLVVALRAGGMLGLFERVLEQGAVDTEHDAAVHRDEAAVTVVGEALVGGDGGQALHAGVVEAEVEDSIHHAGHRELGARAHRHQQRVGGVAQLATHLLFEHRHLRGDLGIETGRPATVHVGTAGVGGDGEARRYRQLQHTGHLGEVGTLSTQEILVLHGRAAVLVVKGVDVRHVNRV